LINDVEQYDKINTPTNETEFIFIPSIFVEQLKSVHIDFLFNEGSFSEMDYPSIQFYMENLINENTSYFLDYNSNFSKEQGGHKEIIVQDFPVPNSHYLLSRMPLWGTPKD